MASHLSSKRLCLFLTASTLALAACGGPELPDTQQSSEFAQVEQAIGTATLSCEYRWNVNANDYQAYCVGQSNGPSWPPETPYWNYLTPGEWWTGFYQSGWDGPSTYTSTVNWYNCLRPYGAPSRYMGVQFKTYNGTAESNIATTSLVGCR